MAHSPIIIIMIINRRVLATIDTYNKYQEANSHFFGGIVRTININISIYQYINIGRKVDVLFSKQKFKKRKFSKQEFIDCQCFGGGGRVGEERIEYNDNDDNGNDHYIFVIIMMIMIMIMMIISL